MATPPYTDIPRVRSAVTRAADTAGTAGGVAEATLEQAIRTAQSTIDSRLGNLYVVPFNPVPPLIRDIATALAAYDADLTFREVRDYSSELNPVLLRYKWASGLLTDIAKGTATLPGYVPPDPDPGIPDNPTDGGSIGEVYNPDLCAIWPRNRRPDPSSLEHWSQW
jgi:phage gp36-like protein